MTKERITYQYTPSSSPQATDIANIGKLSDYLEEDEQNRWSTASKQSEICEKMTDDIGSFHTVEIDGNLHVKGNFNVNAHRIAALWVKGDLIVDGVYEDQSYPQCFVLIEGNLRAKNIVTGAQLEVHGDVNADHLAGDYNDCGAKFFGKTTANTFFPETHHFEFLGSTDIVLTLGQGVPSPKSMDFYACAFINEDIVDSYNEVNKRKLIETLVEANDITHTNPREPSSVTQLRLVERELEVLPLSLYEFVNITDLNLEDNKLTNLDGLERLSKLHTLSIAGNPIDNFSEVLTIPLKSLNVGYWTDLPQWFSRWSTLETLKISVEELEQLPDVVAQIPSLSSLVLTDWFGKYEPLLTDVISKLLEMKLEHLSMSSGKIVTHLPKNLSAFSTLKVLELKDQAFDKTERARIIESLPNVDVRF